MWQKPDGSYSPLITISGEGECGKGTALAWIARNTILNGGKSTSMYAADRIYAQIKRGEWDHETRVRQGLPCPYPEMAAKYNIHPWTYQSEQDCWENRRYMRPFWADWIDNCNRADEDGIGLYRPPLNEGVNVIEGLRWIAEFNSLRRWIDLAIWIDRPGVKRDPTLQYGPEACDIVIQNPTVESGPPVLLYERLHRLFTRFGWMK